MKRINKNSIKRALAAIQRNDLITAKQVLASEDMDQELLVAVKRGDVKAVKKALEQGADPNYDAVIIRASLREDHDIIAALLEAGADIFIKDHKGKTLFDYSKDYGINTVVINQYIENNPDVQARIEREGLDDVIGYRKKRYTAKNVGNEILKMEIFKDKKNLESLIALIKYEKEWFLNQILRRL